MTKSTASKHTTTAASSRVKHGFYARCFNPAEITDLELDGGGQGGLGGEIDMMRVVMRRVFDQALQEAADLESWAKALAALGLASNRIAHLLRTDRVLSASASDVAGALSQALSEVVKELEEAA